MNAILAEHWAKGGEGAANLAKEVVKKTDENNANFKFLYDNENTTEEKINIISKEIYRADEVTFSPAAIKKLKEIDTLGFNHFPVCMAKTQYSFSTDPSKKCAPKDHTITIREIRISAGAEFIVAVAGDIMTMPGLPKKPAAYEVGVDQKDQIKGLF